MKRRSGSFIIKEIQVKTINFSCKLAKIKQKDYANIGENRDESMLLHYNIFGDFINILIS